MIEGAPQVTKLRRGQILTPRVSSLGGFAYAKQGPELSCGSPRVGRPLVPSSGERYAVARPWAGPSRRGAMDAHLLNCVAAVAEAVPFRLVGLGAAGQVGGPCANRVRA